MDNFCPYLYYIFHAKILAFFTEKTKPSSLEKQSKNYIKKKWIPESFNTNISYQLLDYTINLREFTQRHKFKRLFCTHTQFETFLLMIYDLLNNLSQKCIHENPGLTMFLKNKIFLHKINLRLGTLSHTKSDYKSKYDLQTARMENVCR